MSTFDITLTLEQVRVIQDALDAKLISWEDLEPHVGEEAREVAVAEELFTKVFGPIIVSCRHIS